MRKMISVCSVLALILAVAVTANAQDLRKIVNVATPFAFEGDCIYFFDSGTPFFWSVDGDFGTGNVASVAGFVPKNEFNGKKYSDRVVFGGDDVVMANNNNGFDHGHPNHDKCYYVVPGDVEGVYVLIKCNGGSISHVFAKPYDPDPDFGTLVVTNADLEEFCVETHAPIYGQLGKNDTIILASKVYGGTNATAKTISGASNTHFMEVMLPQGNSGTFMLGNGSNLQGGKEVDNSIGIVINWAIDNGYLKLSFDNTKYANIVSGGIIAIVCDGSKDMITDGKDGNAMKPSHAPIGNGTVVTALKAYSPNGDLNHKNAIKWHTRAGGVQAGDKLFIHIKGLVVDDLSNIIGCVYVGCETDTRPATPGTYTINVRVYDANGSLVHEDGLDDPISLRAGWYTVELYVNDSEFEFDPLDTMDVYVSAGGTTEAPFGDVIVGVGECEVICEFCSVCKCTCND